MFLIDDKNIINDINNNYLKVVNLIKYLLKNKDFTIKDKNIKDINNLSIKNLLYQNETIKKCYIKLINNNYYIVIN